MKKTEPCFECQDGKLIEVIEDFYLKDSRGNDRVVKNLPILKCDKCSSECITPDSSRRIEEELKKPI